MLAVPFGRDQFEVTANSKRAVPASSPPPGVNLAILGDAFDRTLTKPTGAQPVATGSASAGASAEVADALDSLADKPLLH